MTTKEKILPHFAEQSAICTGQFMARMRYIKSSPRTAVAIMLGALVLGCSDPPERVPQRQQRLSSELSIEAQSTDGDARFSLSRQMMRDSFESFCKGPPAAGGTCDAFGKYSVHVLIGDNSVTLIFYHLEIENTPPSTVPSFYCWYPQEEPSCHAGSHE